MLVHAEIVSLKCHIWKKCLWIQTFGNHAYHRVFNMVIIIEKYSGVQSMRLVKMLLSAFFSNLMQHVSLRMILSALTGAKSRILEIFAWVSQYSVCLPFALMTVFTQAVCEKHMQIRHEENLGFCINKVNMINVTNLLTFKIRSRNSQYMKLLHFPPDLQHGHKMLGPHSMQILYYDFTTLLSCSVRVL